MKSRALHSIAAAALALGMGTAAPAFAETERCTAVREVHGDGEFSERVRTQLRRVGLLANGPLCQNTAHVRLSHSGKAMQVEISLPRNGAVVRRRCTSVQAAAALIESQLSPNLTADLLQAPLGLAAFPHAATNAPLPAATSLTTPKLKRHLERRHRQPSIAVFTSLMSGADQSTWTGYDIALTSQVGPVVLSMSALVQNNNRIETVNYPTRVQRKREEVRVGIGLETRLGPLRISPRFEVGAAWLEAKRIDAEPTNGDVFDVFCFDDPGAAIECTPGAPIFYGDDFVNSRTEVVSTLRTTASLPLFGRLALTVAVTVDALPFASDQQLPSEWASLAQLPNPEMFAVPAHTRLRAGVSLGLRLGL